jgi:VanZ family protein
MIEKVTEKQEVREGLAHTKVGNLRTQWGIVRAVFTVLFLLLVVVSAWRILRFSTQDPVASNKTSDAVVEVVGQIGNVKEKVPKHTLSEVVRKCAHVSEYAVFGFSVYGFLYLLLCWGNTPVRVRALYTLAALFSGTLLGLIDEFAVQTKSGRGTSLGDVGIDSAGALIGGAVGFALFCGIWSIYVAHARRRAEASKAPCTPTPEITEHKDQRGAE